MRRLKNGSVEPYSLLNILGARRDVRRSIIINDRMQRNYRYELVVPIGGNFHPEFNPDLSPPEMLRLGVFGGKYMTD